jgi:hypothetical protein
VKAIAHNFHLPLTTEYDLKEFIRVAWGITIPDVQVCPNHSTPWRAFADAYFAKHDVTVWKASRGLGGKSFLLALLGLTEAVTLKADVKILGGSGEQSVNVHRYMASEFWEHTGAPRGLLATDPTKMETRLTWGNSIKALAASMRSVRGPHPQRLRLDEIDEMDLSIFDAAMGQTMAQVKDGEIVIPAQTVCSSTHQYADGTMTTVLERAAVKAWPIHEWCYLESHAAGDGWLIQDEIDRKRREVTSIMWQTEYDLQEPNPQNRAFDTGAIRAMFRRDLGEAQGRDGSYLEFEPPMSVCPVCEASVERQKGRCPECHQGTLADAEYSHGADWARKVDKTDIVTFRIDVVPARMVAYERCNRLPWHNMTAKLDDRISRYGGSACHDATGVGDVVDELLNESADGFIFTSKSSGELLTNYVTAVEQGEYVAPYIKVVEGEHRLASVDHLFGKEHLPDSIAACALAHRARSVGWVLR